MVARNLRHVAAAILLLVGLAAYATAAEPVAYQLGFEKPNTHLLDVTITAEDLEGSAVEFAMPAWAPGSYYINNYAKLVQNFRVSDSAGHPLAWRKLDKQTWQVELEGARAVTVRYQVYADTLMNNWAQYNDQHASIGGPAVWMYLVGGKGRPVRLAIAVPSGWRVVTGMSRGADGAFTAADYDWFADSPLEISDFAERDFAIAGTTYHVIVHDALGGKDSSKFFEDLQKLVQVEVPIFAAAVGGPRAAPFEQYWFLFHVWPGGHGGLEHLNSTQIDFPSDWDDTHPVGRYASAYDEKLFITAHEFFHAWNVKRLRPRPLGPFDYSHEVCTRSLWISEGLTSYYGDLALVRAGLISPQAYLDSIAKLITSFEREPGRRERSIEETSWDTWFRDPSMGETNLQNTWYSYYDGGELVGHLLDFAIRQQTGNRKSLDDWMRLLYQRYALPKPGFEPQDAVHAASEIAGKDMTDFFRSYVSGKEPLPYGSYFAYAGIQVEKKYEPNRPWLGAAATRGADGHASIVNITPESPAEQAGLDRGDTILGVNNKPATLDEFLRAVAERKPGEMLKLSVMRRGQLREFAATLGRYPYATYSLRPMEQPTELQRMIYESWLGAKR